MSLTLTVEPGAAGVAAAVLRLRDLLEHGRSVALLPRESETHLIEPDVPSLLLATSGSSGEAKLVQLDRPALLASAALAETRLGGPGLWLTAIPVTGAGGMNTVLRSLQHGAEPEVWPGIAGAAHFDATALLPSLHRLQERAQALQLRAYTSFVPTQVVRLLASARTGDEAAESALQLLARCDAVLVGADALSADVRQDLEARAIPLVSTYGATETCGGCVYDGLPLDGVHVELDADGRITVTGPMVALRYLDDDAALQERRWRSSDIGHWDSGRLLIDGRIDDMVKVGGSSVSLLAVSAAVRSLSGVTDAVVLTTPHGEWGQQPVVFVVAPAVPDAVITHAAADAAQRSSLPLAIVRLSALPMLANGKVDRQALLGMVQ